MTRNTNGDFGIAVAAPNKSMKDGRWINDTRKVKWSVDLSRDPKHVRIFEQRGGTRFILDAAGNHYLEETIFAMKHHMPFPPKFLCYFVTVDTPTGFGSQIGSYTQNHAFMLTNAIGLGEEGLYAQVDDEYFYIKHFAETFAFGSGNTTFYGDQYLFRVRLEILNQPAFYLGDKGY